MYYAVRHVTKYRYSDPVSESIMEVRMQPRSDTGQRCLEFEVYTTPRAPVFSYLDWQGNRVHTFDVPDRHTHLTIRARALVDASPPAIQSLEGGSWDQLATETEGGAFWDMLMPSHFIHPSEALHILALELRAERGPTPYATIRHLAGALHDALTYQPDSTRVDSPIEEALTSRRGVCQDFAHILIALVRPLGIPCRYVSGYLYHRGGQHDRSTPDATHAWTEAWLPGAGWTGFDPTNNLVTNDRHICVAVGRDYADVPPTRGLFRGAAATELAVAVRVRPAEAPAVEPEELEDAPYRPAAAATRVSDQDLQEQPQQ